MAANSPHDALFRYTFGQPEHAAPLLRAILPGELSDAFDWSTLSLCSGTRLDRRLRRHQTDLLFAVRSAAEQALIHVVVEHLSRGDRWTVLRMLDYSVAIWRQIVRQRPRPKRLPRIIPIVLHHGRRRWSAATEFTELLAGAASAGDAAWDQPRFRYQLKSLAGMESRALDGLALTVLGKLSMAAMQVLPWATPAQVVGAFAEWGHLMRQLMLAPSGEEAMAALSEYVLTTTHVTPEVLVEIVEREVDRGAREIMETAASQLRKEGRLEGRVEGRVEGRAEGRAELLTRQLSTRFGVLAPEVVARVAGASIEKLDDWAVRFVDARTLDEVFGEQ